MHNRSVIDSITTRTGKCSFNLDSYGKYAVIAEFPENGVQNKIESRTIRFDGFGADSNVNLTKKIAILGISRLALVVEELLNLAADVDVTFFSSTPKYVGAVFGSGTVKDFWEADLNGFDKWIFMNGISAEVYERVDATNITFGIISSTRTDFLDEYLNLIPLGQLHSLAHRYHVEKLNVGAGFIARYIRKRFGSVLPPAVDLSGARFAYGCISTVINRMLLLAAE